MASLFTTLQNRGWKNEKHKNHEKDILKTLIRELPDGRFSVSRIHHINIVLIRYDTGSEKRRTSLCRKMFKTSQSYVNSEQIKTFRDGSSRHQPLTFISAVADCHFRLTACILQTAV